MTYQEAIDYLYSQHPAFERMGAGAYKLGLETTRRLAECFGNPHQRYPIIHIAGTNGKGSVAHMLAAILQCAGYRVGLFTSPHLVDFNERIRVNGKPMRRSYIINWVQRYRAMHFEGEPSFFELTTIMAMFHFAQQQVDVAVIETGLGGRLDSTNIVTPVLSVITNVSRDHTDLLGEHISQIAAEKAGIIKRGVPVVLGEAGHDDVRSVVSSIAGSLHAPLTIATDSPQVVAHHYDPDGTLVVDTRAFGKGLRCGLSAEYQVNNVNTVLVAALYLRRHKFRIAVREGLEHVVQKTHLPGRWMTLQDASPRVICDSGHNEAGIAAAMRQLAATPHRRLHMVVGFMADKDVATMLDLLPRDATYYFTQAASPRAMAATALRDLAAEHRLHGEAFNTVPAAVQAAIDAAGDGDVVYVGGSMYVLGELLAWWQSEHQ